MFAYDLGHGAKLAPLEPWQAEEFAAFLDGARPHLAPWLPWAQLDSVEAIRAWLQGYADRQARDEGRIYGIWVDGKLSGGTLFRIFDLRSGVCEIGVWLAPEAEGRGLITTAARHMMAWAFESRGMHRVEWRAVPRNERSIAVAKRLGMTLDGVLREAWPHNGRREDSEVWSMVASEWHAGKSVNS